MLQALDTDGTILCLKHRSIPKFYSRMVIFTKKKRLGARKEIFLLKDMMRPNSGHILRINRSSNLVPLQNDKSTKRFMNSYLRYQKEKKQLNTKFTTSYNLTSYIYKKSSGKERCKIA